LRDEAFAADIAAIRLHGTTSEEAKAESNALEISRVQQHADELIAIEQKAADAKKRIVDAENRAKLAAVGSAFGDLASLMNSGSKKAFDIGKKAAVASAAISGTQAAIDAWKSGMSTGGPTAPLVAAAYAAASLAKTGMMIKQINSQQFGGGGGNATSFSGGLPAVNTQQAAPQQTQTVDVRVTASGGGVVDMFNFEVANGANPIMG
jgi:alanyl-tRNA synthetase